MSIASRRMCCIPGHGMSLPRIWEQKGYLSGCHLVGVASRRHERGPVLVRLTWRYIRSRIWMVVTVALLQIVSTMTALSLPSLNADIIDSGVVPGDIAYIWRIGIIMLGLSAVQVACSVMSAYLGARIAMAVGRDTRRDLFDVVQAFGTLEISRFSPASLITRTTNDIQQIQMVLVMTFSIMVQVPIMLVGAVVMALRQDVQLSAILVAVIPLLAGIMAVVGMKLSPLFRTIQQRLDGISTVLREQITGVRVIRAFVMQDSERARYASANTELRDVSMRVGLLMALLFPAVTFVLMGAQVAVVFFGGFRVESGMEIGALTAFITYLVQIFISVMMAMMMFMMVPRAMVCADRVVEVLDTTPVIGSPAQAGQLPPSPVTFALNDVTFRFPGAERDVLVDVSLELNPGTTTAIIGSTGSGKSTLVNLLPRLLDPSSGTVTASGIPVSQLPLSYRERIAMVPQRAHLFSGTIASNLRIANPAATDEELWHAIEVAQAREFVPDLDARVESAGRNFSGGQRQRLTIARALVRRADLTVFDDSFSALDYATDARLRGALKNYLSDGAVLIVGQRVATIRSADTIVVLDAGQIVGSGSHEHLMETCPTYQEIVLSQLSAEEAS